MNADLTKPQDLLTGNATPPACCESDFKQGMEQAALWHGLKSGWKTAFAQLDLLKTIERRGNSFRDGVKFFCDMNDIDFPTALHDVHRMCEPIGLANDLHRIWGEKEIHSSRQKFIQITNNEHPTYKHLGALLR
jgi:hypothetical protein